MGSADYDLLLQEIGRDLRRTGLDKAGYKFTLSDEEPVYVHVDNEEES